MADVVDFSGITLLDLDPDRVLAKAMSNMSEVVIVGFHKDGSEYFASSVSSGADTLWHLERAKHKLMRIVDTETE